MKSRLIAGAAAIVLAIVGALLVFTYAQAANERAVAGLEPVSVLVVQEPVPAGTTAEMLLESVEVEHLPASAIARGALQNLKGAEGKVTAVDLVAGEQLLAKRLVSPREAKSAGAIQVPKGLQEVSFLLEPQRVVGGTLSAGDHVGILVSFEEGPADLTEGGPTTQFVFHRVLVTNVQGAPAPTPDTPEGSAEPLPAGSLMITVAVDDMDAADIVFGSEFGTLWLTKEPKDASVSDPSIVTKNEVYK